MAPRMPWSKAPEPVHVPSVTPQRAALDDERRRLAELVAESTWDLGGLVYEMAVRDHFRVDVLTQRAAELQRLDARLSEVERLVADHEGIGGHCRFCGAPHGRSAEFCWSCGERLLVRQVLGTIEGTVAAPPVYHAQPAATGPDQPTREQAVVPGDAYDPSPREG
ncbi:hypothetical protein [Patulibacter americanus]|uniref:hypothetical protein n=1 Tax=Patulibacter americanus TaxID=588672 RepID=UPI00040281D5|nr:hypothetical protein [Patulibacter americanus]